jgi:hypothetical protein
MRARARFLLPALLGAASLIVAGCASSSDGSSGSGSGGGSGASNATVAFASPMSDAKVKNPVDVSFTVQGAKIGRPETGDMHLHVYVDDSSAYTILYATQGQVKVPDGQHTLKVVLAQPNHTETSVTATEKVDVSGGGGATAPTTTSGGYGYP